MVRVNEIFRVNGRSEDNARASEASDFVVTDFESLSTISNGKTTGKEINTGMDSLCEVASAEGFASSFSTTLPSMVILLPLSPIRSSMLSFGMPGRSALTLYLSPSSDTSTAGLAVMESKLVIPVQCGWDPVYMEGREKGSSSMRNKGRISRKSWRAIDIVGVWLACGKSWTCSRSYKV